MTYTYWLVIVMLSGQNVSGHPSAPIGPYFSIESCEKAGQTIDTTGLKGKLTPLYMCVPQPVEGD